MKNPALNMLTNRVKQFHRMFQLDRIKLKEYLSLLRKIKQWMMLTSISKSQNKASCRLVHRDLAHRASKYNLIKNKRSSIN